MTMVRYMMGHCRFAFVRVALLCLLFSGVVSCYTLSQGLHQARLLFKREDLAEVLARADESPERLSKLRQVPAILAFSKDVLGLAPGDSYTTYVRLPQGQPLTWVVQAAEKRVLKRKTWWFPVVGEQPYLGFFVKADALDMQKELQADGLDTRVGAVDAFSMLGFLSDPIYSSMIDGRSLVDVVDLLLHETLHRTIYVPGHSVFNESLADFVAKKGAVLFFEKIKDQDMVPAHELDKHLAAARREHEVGLRFKAFLEEAKIFLAAEYQAAAAKAELRSESAFMEHRSTLFKRLERDFDAKLRSFAQGTWYENAFRADRLNNAVILAYQLYEARSEPFESALKNAGGDLALMVRHLKKCLKNSGSVYKSDPAPDSGGWISKEESESFWTMVATCQ